MQLPSEERGFRLCFKGVSSDGAESGWSESKRANHIQIKIWAGGGSCSEGDGRKTDV